MHMRISSQKHQGKKKKESCLNQVLGAGSIKPSQLPIATSSGQNWTFWESKAPGPRVTEWWLWELSLSGRVWSNRLFNRRGTNVASENNSVMKKYFTKHRARLWLCSCLQHIVCLLHSWLGTPCQQHLHHPRTLRFQHLSPPSSHESISLYLPHAWIVDFGRRWMISLVGALPLKRMVWAKCAQSYCLIILLTFRHMVWTFCLSYQNNLLTCCDIWNDVLQWNV